MQYLPDSFFLLIIDQTRNFGIKLTPIFVECKIQEGRNTVLFAALSPEFDK